MIKKWVFMLLKLYIIQCVMLFPVGLYLDPGIIYREARGIMNSFPICLYE